MADREVEELGRYLDELWSHDSDYLVCPERDYLRSSHDKHDGPEGRDCDCPHCKEYSD